jgi:hypothetical protein
MGVTELRKMRMLEEETGASGPNHGQWVTAQPTKAAKQAMAKLCNGKPIFGDDGD